MKQIALISILILLSFTHSFKISDINLTSLTSLFLPDLNNLLKPISASKSAGPLKASVNVNFNKINQKDIYVGLESSEIRIRISNFVAESKAELETFRWVKIIKKIPIIGKLISKVVKKTTSVSAKGKIKTTIDLKFKLVLKDTGMPGIEITYFRTNTDLSFIFGNAKVSPFSGIISPIRKEVEKKILDKLAKTKLQNLVDKIVNKLLNKLTN